MALSVLDRFELDADERVRVEDLVEQLRSEYAEATGTAYVQRAAELSVGLPARLVSFLESYRREQLTAAVVVSGFETDDESLGTTPPHWRERNRPTSREDAYLMLLSSSRAPRGCAIR